MKVLVIKGKSSLGEIFSMENNKDMEITLINRHEINKIKEDFDVIVDFGAYIPNDIKLVLDNINTKKYIYISTVDVYEKGTRIKTENTPLNTNTNKLDPILKQYVDNKIYLEYELIDEAMKHNVEYISIRLGKIYGPYNLSSSELMFFDNIINYKTAIYPIDSDSLFEIVYIKDVIEAIKLLCLSNKKNIYNISSNELLRYEYLSKMYKRIINEPYEEIFMPYKDIIMHGIGLPYPVFKNEEQLTSSLLFKNEFKDFNYTRTEEGLRNTYNEFKKIYKRNDTLK